MAGNHWFLPHTHGYGATPCTWQGWACVAATVAVIIALGYLCFGAEGGPTAWGIVLFIAGSWVAVIALILVARAKTKGAWRWRWGGDA
ncbi:MAG: hypothetical protein ACFCVH_18340 [Alphaproteobacteria bacterium]